MKNLLSVFLVNLFLFFLCTEGPIAQQQASDTEFPIGAYTYIDTINRHIPGLYSKFAETGMNTISVYVDNGTRPFLNNYNVIGDNQDNEDENGFDWIRHYSTAYYSKWEAEDSTPYDEIVGVGVKHKYGQLAEWKYKQCWSSIGLNSPKDSLVFGPHYHQETFYHRYYYYPYVDWYILKYTPRFRMALDKDSTVTDNENVCVIKIVHRFTKIENEIVIGTFEEILRIDTIKVSRFNANGTFTDITFEELPVDYYEYDTRFRPYYNEERAFNMRPIEPNSTVRYTDIWYPDNGIQFCVDWLRNDTLCTLYIDYAEVYDNDGWNDYIFNSTTVSNRITTYAQNYSGWQNLKYWHGSDEPGSIDNIIPQKKVNQILDSAVSKPLVLTMTIPTPEYWPLMNGERLYKRYLDAVQPEIMINNYFPFYVGEFWTVPTSFEYLRAVLQETHLVYPNSWYDAQTFGYMTEGGVWKDWRKPDSTELKASVMLGLAHGSKGIMFWKFDANWDKNVPRLYNDAIVDLNFEPTELFYVIKDNFVPRLKGSLGKTLLGLNYSGDFLQYKYITPTQNPLPQPPTYDYLTIGLQATNHDMNWHVGFFVDSVYSDNKYFLMANLWTNSSKSLQVKVTEPVQGYTNYRFRNIESANNFDITFNTETTQTLNFPAGEGYLFQVAPVVRYGGKLVYNENVGEGMSLYDDMTIENGATLFIYDTYNAKANITVKSGGKIMYGENSIIIFDPGKKLIVEGSAEIKGTSTSNKLTLQFSGNDNAVLVKPGSSLTMDYCNITGAYQGIVTETGSRSYVNISNTNISAVYCGISLVSNSSSEEMTSQIYNCSISSNLYGISVSNYNLILIKENTLTGCAINISNSASAFLQGNVITGGGSSTTYGIFMSSSTGYVRSNTITNCLNGIHLANSSPDVGGNILQGNVKHGLFIGSGSIPNLVAHLQLNPPLYFPLSGYNKIYSNGSITNSDPFDNYDGSEIYLANTGILLSNGCNQISDDRQSTPTMNTLKLICGSLYNGGRSLNAIYNYWGSSTPTASRFSGFSVVFSPYYTENCPLPDGGSGGEESLILRTSTGLVVDSIYAADGVPENYTDLQVTYSEADNLFATGNVTQAKPLYEQIC